MEPDFNQPQMSPVSPPPQGAPPGWRPLSGLALTGFILSLLLGVASAVSGAYWLAGVAALTCVAGLMRANPARYRGRGFAIAGLVIALGFGAVAYTFQASARAVATHFASNVMRVLDAEVADDVRVERLRDWLHPAAVEAGEIDVLRARWDDLIGRMGPYKGEVEAGSLFGGHMAVLMGPQEASLVQSDAPTEGPPDFMSTSGKVFWSRAMFEKGVVHVAVFLQRDLTPADSENLSNNALAVLKTVRFYVPPAAK